MKRKFSLFLSGLCFFFGGGDMPQAQLAINVYPSQDNTNKTIWIFSGSSTTRSANSIRVSTTDNAYQLRDLWDIHSSRNIYPTNGSSAGQVLSLSPLFSSTNATDIASVRARIPGGGKTDIAFSSSATNQPGITIRFSYRQIHGMYMRNYSPGTSDEMGIRVSGASDFGYSANHNSIWSGSGILDKPISDFTIGGPIPNTPSGPLFAAAGSGSVRLTINSGNIPEPEEYALVFSLFALGFVFFHRHRQKKQRQQQQASSS